MPIRVFPSWTTSVSNATVIIIDRLVSGKGSGFGVTKERGQGFSPPAPVTNFTAAVFDKRKQAEALRRI